MCRPPTAKEEVYGVQEAASTKFQEERADQEGNEKLADEGRLTRKKRALTSTERTRSGLPFCGGPGTIQTILMTQRLQELTPELLGELPKKLDLKGQYVKRLSTLRHFGFIGEKADPDLMDVDPPSYEAVKNSFTRAELELALTFHQPTLLIIPESSLTFKIRALSKCKEAVLKHETYVHELYKTTDTGPDRIAGWRAVIVDGIPEMETVPGDDINARFADRVKKRTEQRNKLDKGMDRHKYCHLMMESVRAGSPVDRKMFTFLDADPALSAANIPTADYDLNNNWIRFNWRYPDDVNVCARFRPSVGGEKVL